MQQQGIQRRGSYQFDERSRPPSNPPTNLNSSSPPPASFSCLPSLGRNEGFTTKQLSPPHRPQRFNHPQKSSHEGSHHLTSVPNSGNGVKVLSPPPQAMGHQPSQASHFSRSQSFRTLPYVPSPQDARELGYHGVPAIKVHSSSDHGVAHPADHGGFTKHPTDILPTTMGLNTAASFIPHNHHVSSSPMVGSQHPRPQSPGSGNMADNVTASGGNIPPATTCPPAAPAPPRRKSQESPLLDELSGRISHLDVVSPPEVKAHSEFTCAPRVKHEMGAFEVKAKPRVKHDGGEQQRIIPSPRTGDDSRIWGLLEGLKDNEVTVGDALDDLEIELSGLTQRRANMKTYKSVPDKYTYSPSRSQKRTMLSQSNFPKKAEYGGDEYGEDFKTGDNYRDEVEGLRYLLSQEKSRRLELEAQLKAYELRRRLSPRTKVSDKAYHLVLKALVGLCGHGSALAASHRCLRLSLWQIILSHAQPVRKADDELDALVSYIQDAMENQAISGDFAVDGCQSPGAKWWTGDTRGDRGHHHHNPPTSPYRRGPARTYAQDNIAIALGTASQATRDPIWNWWYSSGDTKGKGPGDNTVAGPGRTKTSAKRKR